MIFDQLFPENNLWFTASSRDGGVRFKKIWPISSHWDIVNIDVNIKDEQYLFDWANMMIGDKYSYWNCARFVLPFLPTQDTRWICSTICIVALQEICKLSDDIIADDFSPQDFYNYINR